MSSSDRRPLDHDHQEADTANFQQFMNDPAAGAVDRGRTFRLVSLLVGIAVLVALVLLLLF